MRARSASRIVGVALLAIALLGACGDDGTTSAGGDGTTTVLQDQDGAGDRDRDRDRDRIHQVIEDVLDACGDQDRDRLRDHLGDQARDRLRDGSCDELDGESETTVLSEDITVDGDTATAELRFRIRDRDGETHELGETWHFRWSEADGWQLSEVPDSLE